jgi:hypothetical protein
MSARHAVRYFIVRAPRSMSVQRSRRTRAAGCSLGGTPRSMSPNLLALVRRVLVDAIERVVVRCFH